VKLKLNYDRQSVLSLTRGRVCNLLLLLLLASAVSLGSKSRGTQDHILLSQFLKLSQPGGPVPVFISPRNRYTPGHWVPFPSSLTTRKATVEVFYLASAREIFEINPTMNFRHWPHRKHIFRSSIVGRVFFFLLEIPYLFAVCNNTFRKWWEGWRCLVEEYSVALLCYKGFGNLWRQLGMETYKLELTNKKYS
jgi:hypothetical protein